MRHTAQERTRTRAVLASTLSGVVLTEVCKRRSRHDLAMLLDEVPGLGQFQGSGQP